MTFAQFLIAAAGAYLLVAIAREARRQWRLRRTAIHPLQRIDRR